MPMPVRSLPVLQNWDCHGCSDCCRTYSVNLTERDRKKIDSQGWDADPDFRNQTLYVPNADGSFRLNHRDDEACVFLGADSRCRIHAKFGSAAKPMACRIYPFFLVPTGDHWRVSIRYGCPSAADNRGRPVSDQLADARTYATLIEEEKKTPADLPAPPLQAGQSVNWSDLLRFMRSLVELIDDRFSPIERKLRQALELARMCRQARFEAISGSRLEEFLTIIRAAVIDETPAESRQVGAPGWTGRLIFRQVVALYSRKDVGFRRGQMASRGVLGRISAGWRFATGSGLVPPVHALIPTTATFLQAEQASGPLSGESESLLTRYYRTKLESLQFCGRTNFDLPFWDGLDSLILTFPAIMWLSRVLNTDGRTRDEAVRLAMQIVDDNFGFNPLLGSAKQRWAVRMLSLKNELPRLVAWYGR